MWPKNSLDGIRSAISSRRVMSKDIRFEFRRYPSEANAMAVEEANALANAATAGAVASAGTEVFELTLSRPLGINADYDPATGYVLVTGLNGAPGASNPRNLDVLPSLRVGDRIVAVDSSLGSQMWPVTSIAGLVSACTSRFPQQKVTLRFQRVGQDGGAAEKAASGLAAAAAQKAAGADQRDAAAAAAPGPPSAATLEEGARTTQLLLSRCRAVLRKYTAQYRAGEVGARALGTVTDRVVEALAHASARPDAKAVHMIMGAYLAGGRADDALRIFEAATGIRSDGTDRQASTVVTGSARGEQESTAEKDGGEEGGGAGSTRIMPSLSTLNLYTATSVLKAHSMKKDGVAAARVLAAMEGRDDLVVDGVKAASWPRASDDNWLADSRCYNIVLAAASKMRSAAGLRIVQQTFDRMLDPMESKEEWAAVAGGTIFRDAVSYNTMIAAYARSGNVAEATETFQTMKKRGFTPDKFSYTSLIKASVVSGDIDGARAMLTDMETNSGVEADVFAYNTVIKGLCDKYRWYEAKELVTDMEWNGITPDSYTYGMLMHGFVKADKPGPALTLFETACSDPRTASVAQNVEIYTTAVTAATMVGDHPRALGLVSRMVAAGVKPNLKTFTSLLGGCLSSGKTSYAIDIFGKITEPDGYALQLGIRAFSDAGDFSSATGILRDQRDGRREMSGKQVTESYSFIIESALRQRNYEVAKDALTESLDSGYIPSKKALRGITAALNLLPKKGIPRSRVNDNNRVEAEEAFDFVLFVLDGLAGRNLSVPASFYSTVLFEGGRIGGLRKKVASLVSMSRYTSMEGGEKIEVGGEAVLCDDGEANVSCIGWVDIVREYDAVKDRLGLEIAVPTMKLTSTEREIRTMLQAEQSVSYVSSRRRRVLL